MTMSIEEISDRLEIQDLIVKYAYAIDTRDWAALDEVFTPDAFVDYSSTGGAAGALPEIKEFLGAAMPGFTSTQHMMATTTMTISGDSAEAKTICHNPMVCDDRPDPTVMFCGIWYVDHLTRTDAGWRITSRVLESSYTKVLAGNG